MYKTSKEQQLTFDGFNQSCGMKLNPKDEYVILADMIDWAAVEANVESRATIDPDRRTDHRPDRRTDHRPNRRTIALCAT